MTKLWHQKGGTRRKRWRVRWLHKDRVRTASFETERDAREFRIWADAQELEAKYGKTANPLPPVTPSLEETIREYMRHHRSTHAETTSDRDAGILTDWSAEIKTLPVAAIRSADITKWLGSLKTDSTRHRHLAAIKGFLTWCVKHDPPWLPANPCDRVAVRKLDEKESAWLTDDQYAALCAACSGETLDVVEFLANTGMRVSEMLALRYSDIRGDRITIARQMQKGKEVRTKGSAFRVVELNRQAKTVLARRERKGEHLFPGLTRRAIYGRINKAGKAAGIEASIGPHTLRHTFGAHLVHSDAPMVQVQAAMGHKSIVVTERIYGHLRPDSGANVTRHLNLSP